MTTHSTQAKPKVWVDGCFDFSHHGHANAVLQARQLSSYLCAGVHSDEDILHNKGPPVMNLTERQLTLESMKWVDEVIPSAPYVTSLDVLAEYGCDIVVHGDDITTDADGNDTYRHVKEAGMFVVVPRTKSISTTDLVGRMLLVSKAHFMNRDASMFEGEYLERVSSFASGRDGLTPWSSVWFYTTPGKTTLVIPGQVLRASRRVVYVDGGFDLFSSGHITFLKTVRQVEPDAYILCGIHSDRVINHEKGLNYPIMNLFERSLCVLACQYVDGVLIGAPFAPASDLGIGRQIDAVYHGPSAVPGDPYATVREEGIYHETMPHDFEEVNAKTIVERIMKSRDLYEERQRKKLQKSGKEKTLEEIEKSK